tara:strand:- start:118 stop:1233 length:1116 start_codon:yes stop_codon:yes gene_type:complete
MKLEGKIDKFRLLSLIYRKINLFITFIIFLLVSIGSLILYSATGGSFDPLVYSHLIKFGISFTLFIIICFLKHEVIYEYSHYFFIFCFATLCCLPFLGLEIAGSKRWINLGYFSIQPSEITKVAIILTLSKYYSDFSQTDNSSIIKTVLPCFIIIIPVLLIINQPDLGTAILLALCGLSIIFISGVSLNIMIAGSVLLFATIPLIWINLYQYQKQRILTFFNPENDPLGSGYHIAQSKIAIGSGGFTGKGLMEGTQSQLEFIPEIHTDFVFSIFSEEFGFFGSMLIFILYSILIYYGIYASIKAKNLFNKLVISGLTINTFLYFFINISMVIGVIPVVGVPLPLISFGGSAMLAFMISFGIIMNLSSQEKI